MNQNKLSILGIRGIPANHGGFETFAEKLALYLVGRKWKVTVYCQDDNVRETIKEKWKGIELIKIPSKVSGALGTIIFDYKAMMMAKESQGIFLTLGYNTAIFCVFLKLKNKINIINMDGLEWKRRKYNILEKSWLFINEKLGIYFSNHLIADNPGIEQRLRMISLKNKKISMIPYGANSPTISSINQRSILEKINISSKIPYVLVVARPVPENNIFEIVQTFSQKKRNHNLVILGRYNEKVSYHTRVLSIASEEVIFLGAIYDKKILNVLRTNAKLYIHGHSVGGTNPTLIEAMSAGMPVLAHDNTFNRWVAGKEMHYFSNEKELDKKLVFLLSNTEEMKKMSYSSIEKFQKDFTWGKILSAYEKVFHSYFS